MAKTQNTGDAAPTAAAKATATRRRRSAATAVERTTAVDRTREVSGEVLQSVEDAQRVAIETAHKFVETVERLPPSSPPNSWIRSVTWRA